MAYPKRLKIRRFNTRDEALEFIKSLPDLYLDSVKIFHYIEKDDNGVIELEQWDVYANLWRWPISGFRENAK